MADIHSTFSCNRQPFLSGDGCDRGNVDIHQFDDLPYCDPINPTPADIPPEVIDTLQIPLVPPPCACIDIKYVLRKFKYSKALKFLAEFKSIGDCCKGNYQADFDIELPCPIKKIDKKWYRQRLKWNQKSKVEKIYIQDAKDCGLEPFDIDVELGLKCPVRTNGKKKIAIGLDWGKKQKKQEKKYVDTQNDDEDCSITPADVDFDLELPCPIPNGDITLRPSIKWGRTFVANDVILAKGNQQKCEIELQDAAMDLEIPCPFDNLRFSGAIHKGSTNSINITKRPSANCGLDVDIDIAVAASGDCEGIRIKHPYNDRYVGCLCGDQEAAEPILDADGRLCYAAGDFTLVEMKLLSRGGCCCEVDCVEDYDLDLIYVIKTTLGWKYVSVPSHIGGLQGLVYPDELQDLEYEPDPGCSSGTGPGCYAIDSDNKLINQYFIRGGVVETGGFDGDLSAYRGKILALKIAAMPSGPVSLEPYSSIGDLITASKDPDYIVMPLYQFADDGTVAVDFRNAPRIQTVEVP